MAYREPPSDEELKRLEHPGEGCSVCENKGSHGHRTVCRLQVAGRYNREIFSEFLKTPDRRPPWCPKKYPGRSGYASSEPIPEPTEPPKKTPGPGYQTGPNSPMPTTPAKTATGRFSHASPSLQDIPKEKKVEAKPPPKKPKLKRRPRDAPWGKED